jgi:hypothetical protein
MGEIQAFKTVIGEEIVGEVVEIIRSLPTMLLGNTQVDGDITAYRVRRPHILRFIQSAQGANLAFIPWTLCNPTIEVMTIPASAILLTFPPSAMVEKQYLEQTSGLSLVSSGTRISK